MRQAEEREKLRHPVGLIVPAELGHIHFIAIGGSGMSGIALAYHELGITVSGCDQVDSPVMSMLKDKGIQTWVGHDLGQLDGVDTVVVSSAIRPDNVELVAAQEKGLRIWHRSAALAALMLDHVAVSVAGTHGKTTTTAMIATMASVAGADPSYVIGSPLAATGQSALIGKGKPFIVEADESDGSFLQYPTQIAVITNIEADHLDNWGTPAHYAQGFTRFATGETVKYVVIDADDPGTRDLAARLRTAEGAPQVITYGESSDADARLTDMKFEGLHARATLHYEGTDYDLNLAVPGKHNLWNAAAAFVAGRLLGLDAQRLARGAEEFKGTLRRFQPVGHVQLGSGELSIFDDYAHHPTEIRAALEAGRRVAGNRRLVACFQPHLYSRTQEFASEFGKALAMADKVVVTDVYPAREQPISGVSGELIADVVADCGTPTDYVENKAELPARLAQIVRGGDLVITLGAGDVTLVGPLLLGLLTEEVNGSRADV